MPFYSYSYSLQGCSIKYSATTHHFAPASVQTVQPYHTATARKSSLRMSSPEVLARYHSPDAQANTYLVHLMLLGGVAVGKHTLRKHWASTHRNDVWWTLMGVEGTRFHVRPHVITDHEQWIQSPSLAAKFSDGYCVLYDITRASSLDEARAHLHTINVQTPAEKSRAPVLLLGNKSDLEADRQVSAEQGQALAAEYCVEWIETTINNRHEAFTQLMISVKHHHLDSNAHNIVAMTPAHTSPASDAVANRCTVS